MDDPKQNIQPDFGFIVNQKLPEPDKPKKIDKRIILIGVLLAAMLLIVVGAALFGKPQQPTTTTTTPDQATPAAQQAPGATNTVAQKFVELMSNTEIGSTQQVVNLLSSELKPDQVFAQASMLRIKNSVDFSSCRKDDATSKQNLTRYICQSVSGKPLVLAIETKTVDNHSVITSIKVEPHA